MAKKTKIVHVAVEPDKYRQLKALASEFSCPVSQLIRYAVSNLLISKGGLLDLRKSKEGVPA